jgi:predicted CopG family antitoxin
MKQCFLDRGLSNLAEWLTKDTSPVLLKHNLVQIIDELYQSPASGAVEELLKLIDHGVHRVATKYQADIADLEAANTNQARANAEVEELNVQQSAEIDRLNEGTAHLTTEVDRLQAIANKNLTEASDLKTQLLATLTKGGSDGVAFPAPSRRSIAKDPEVFSAVESDSAKRFAEYQSWKTKIQIRWAQDSHEFTTNIKKILHVAGLLGGKAYMAISTGVDKVLANPDNPTAWPWATGEQLLIDLDRKYKTIDIVADAEKKLKKLVQKDEYSVFSDFISEFVSLADRCNLDAAQRVRDLRGKVSGPIRRALVNQVNQPGREDFEAWLTLLSALAANIENDEFYKKLHKDERPQQQPKQAPKPTSQDSGAMDLDKMTINRLTPEELKRRIREGLCKRCAEPGHIAQNCPLRGNQGQGHSGGRGGAHGRGYDNLQQHQRPYQYQPYQQQPFGGHGGYGGTQYRPQPGTMMRALDTPQPYQPFQYQQGHIPPQQFNPGPLITPGFVEEVGSDIDTAQYQYPAADQGNGQPSG